ncbi:MAG: SDR family oxidoreductase [Saprospiraceae bacterium]|jgi:NAD(P)-dependent dehydrogenase (short-subunit alcohol dehydrogenase family)|nr:SDR family oxidoreductase [Saprospiraceae bacterium]
MDNLDISNLFSVKGKTVLVTGGSRGIGLMIASTFVKNGAKVYISSRNAAVCQAVEAELSKIGECIAIPADLSTTEGQQNLVAEFNKRETSLDVLINNAGANWSAPFKEYPEKGYDKVMDINVKPIFFLTQAFLPLLKESASLETPARIINIGSIDGIRVSTIDNSAYGMSKAAVHHLTKILSVKMAGKGITVNAIAPGPFPSKMTKTMLDSAQAMVEKVNPMRRIGRVGDMGGIAVFLASEAGAYLNGTVIPVDGEMHLLAVM